MVAATLSGSCPRLASLSLAGCTRLSDEGLGHLAALTRLTSLDLSGCATKAGELQARTPGIQDSSCSSLQHPQEKDQ